MLEDYQISDDPPLYLVGCFDQNVTVLSQQIRALNLAACLIETGVVPNPDEPAKNIAIVGAGFAGLTLAAALLRKRAAVNIVLFEERDTLLPLQQGSDSRWLHPHIYDWPADYSEASAAMLPVLNWTAARASDVVVQVLAEWRAVVTAAKCPPRLYCNTRHLQIDWSRKVAGNAQVEWIGEQRTPEDGHDNGTAATGNSEAFAAVVLAVGFGLEKEAMPSYWRNETLGQPSLSQNRATYLVSGQGDGAMIDLLRIRISQYRQDRILEELFHDKPSLKSVLRTIKNDLTTGKSPSSLFSRFEELASASPNEWQSLIKQLQVRLRRDTDAVLHLRESVRSLDNLIEPADRRMSFQNALLVFLLYKCGGFAPSVEDEAELRKRLGISNEHFVRRYGPQKRVQVERLLSSDLAKLLKPDGQKQKAEIRWEGGYFGYPGPREYAKTVASHDREGWRKEYLPGPTALAATTITSAIAGLLGALRPQAGNYRVTLHRALELHAETLLQQACEYAGRTDPPRTPTLGRTFSANVATIGQAFGSHRVIRSKKDVAPERLQEAMDLLKLTKDARDMRRGVNFVLAFPILQPSSAYFGITPVAGVVYIDSSSVGFWLNDLEVGQICTVVGDAVRGLDHPKKQFDRIRNIRLATVRTRTVAPTPLRPDVQFALEEVEVIPPTLEREFQLNFDFSDLVPLAPAT